MTDPCDGECMCSSARGLDWAAATPEEFADAIEGICVERGGECKCNPCKCKNGDVAEPGEW